MQTPTPIPSRTDTGSAPPERGRVWRIVIIVLALHAALLGSVVLIQGCGSKEAPAMTMNEALDASKSVDNKTLAATEETNSTTNANIICPRSDILTPEEKLPLNDTAPVEASPAPPVPDLIATQPVPPRAEAPAPVTETPKVEPPPVAPVSPAVAPAPVKYTVCKGDTLSRIAKKKNVSLKHLAELNKMTTSARLKIGQKLRLPADGAKTSTAAEAPASEKTMVAKAEKKPAAASKRKPASALLAGKKTHTVKPGESLYSISRRYHVSMQSLMKVNRISDPRKVRVSQKLVLPVIKTSAAKLPAKADSGLRMVTNPPATNPPAVAEPDIAAPLEEPVAKETTQSTANPTEEPSALGEEVEGT